MSLTLLVITELVNPHNSPTNTDKNASWKKLPTILKGVAAVKELSGPEYCITVLKRIIQTASLVIPSPKTRLNSFGYSSYLMIEIAATTSVQHSREHINNISDIDKYNGEYSLSQCVKDEYILPRGSIIFFKDIQATYNIGKD